MSDPLPIFVGFDPREATAWDVCADSLRRHSSLPLHIVKLEQAALRKAGWYRRDWRVEGADRIDMGDNKPFSTEFAFTRFMVPALSLYQGWALFCDCDFLFTQDISRLFALADDRYAVLCVKHQHDQPKETTKMGGLTQTAYRRKNWSSLVLWNCAHPENELLSGYVVNQFNGQWLHAFSWLDDALIGSIPQDWNWLAGVSQPLAGIPAGIHYTLGVPDMPGCENTPYAALWRTAKAQLSGAAMEQAA